MHYPIVDPIPVPAPIWLMKVLGLLTLATHFVAVQLLIGSLVAVIYFSTKGKSGSAAHKTAAYVIARRLPIIMTFIINLGIPPLLFAQVIYGRALYTSSVLIGAVWISVIFILMAVYWILYRIMEKTKAGLPAGHLAGIALLLAATVGRILSYNMTLMLRPEVWQQMYSETATGLHLPPDEPTSLFRWGFVVIGSLLMAGLWLALHSGLPTIDDEAKALLRKTGGVLALLGGILQIGFGIMVFVSQPANIQAAMQDGNYGLYFKIAGGLWIVTAVLATLLGATQIAAKNFSLPIVTVGSLCAFLGLCGFVCVRDVIRDVTLMSKNLNIWDRVVYPNWWVLGLFLLLFAITLYFEGWLLWVMKQAKAVSEEVTS